MISLDATLLIQMGVVFVLFLVLGQLFFKPILHILTARQEHIEKANNEKEEKVKAVAALVEKYEAAIAAAKEKAYQNMEQVKKEGLEKEREILEKIHAEHADAIHEAKQRARKELEEASKDISAQAKEISLSISEKILQRKIS